jgi:hypothetical protein
LFTLPSGFRFQEANVAANKKGFLERLFTDKPDHPHISLAKAKCKHAKATPRRRKKLMKAAREANRSDWL